MMAPRECHDIRLCLILLHEKLFELVEFDIMHGTYNIKIRN